ncbi:MAG TPA: hypothetical protein PK263_06050 [bacterium]|nr:hypothetical protein [bacterium]
MKKTNSYTLTLTLDTADQRVVEQLFRESKGMMPTIESVVYQQALEGLRAQLEAKRQANREKLADRKASKAAETLKAAAIGGNGAKTNKSAVSAQ